MALARVDAEVARLAGTATPEGTTRYRARFPAAAHHFGQLGGAGLTISRVGFGGYRVDDRSADHAQALRTALLEGCNLIDTAMNYGGGASERLVGQVVTELVREGALCRDEVVVVTKLGYLEGAALKEAEAREAAGRPYPEVLRFPAGGAHCLHPEFLSEQLDHCLARLRLEAVDVCLLHNPEYHLTPQRGADAAVVSEDELYRRIGAAFRCLEEACRQGRIGVYGVSSNTLGSGRARPGHVSLERLLDAAEAAGGPDHHFRVVQLPINLVECEAVLGDAEPGAGERPLLERAHAAAVAVLANRPLNANAEGRLLRLAEVNVPDAERTFAEAHAQLALLEDEYRRTIAACLPIKDRSLTPERLFRVSEIVSDLPAQSVGLRQWQHAEARMTTALMRTLAALDGVIGDDLLGRWRSWRDGYRSAVEQALRVLRQRAARATREETAALMAALDPLLSPEHRRQGVAARAIAVLAATPGVSAVLVGMRRPEYVREALGALDGPPIEDVRLIYERARTHTLEPRG